MDQVQVQSIHCLILPAILPADSIKAGSLKEKCGFVRITSPPKLTIMTFQPFLTKTITINASGTGKAPSTLQIAMYRPSPADLEYSLPPLWTIQSPLVGLSESKSTSISIHGYVDLRRSIILCGKYSSIDLSSIDSNGIRSPCTWLPNTGYSAITVPILLPPKFAPVLSSGPPFCDSIYNQKG